MVKYTRRSCRELSRIIIILVTHKAIKVKHRSHNRLVFTKQSKKIIYEITYWINKRSQNTTLGKITASSGFSFNHTSTIVRFVIAAHIRSGIVSNPYGYNRFEWFGGTTSCQHSHSLFVAPNHDENGVHLEYCARWNKNAIYIILVRIWSSKERNLAHQKL